MIFFNKKKSLTRNSIKKKTVFISGILFGILPFIFIVYLLLSPLVKVIHKDFSSKTMIVISEELNIRSDKNKDAYVIGHYPFGTEVKVFEVFDNNWAEVSVGPKKGYMSFQYLVLPETFYTIEGMFGNKNAKKLISSVKYRKAISKYLKTNGFTSKIPKSEREKLYGKDDNKEIWQIFAEPKLYNFNTFCYGDYNGDNKRDAAFIITNIKSGTRKLIILNIENDTKEDYGGLITFRYLKEDYQFIKHISKRTKMITNDSINRIGVDGILIGTNRDNSLNDIPTLMLYNGKTFDFYNQKK